jgi:hypothetical protein
MVPTDENSGRRTVSMKFRHIRPRGLKVGKNGRGFERNDWIWRVKSDRVVVGVMRDGRMLWWETKARERSRR